MKENKLPLLRNTKIHGFIMWLVGAIFYFYQFIGRIIPGIASTELMNDLNLTAGAFGTLMSTWYIVYALCQIPCGILLDRYNPKIIMSISCSILVIGTYIFGKATSHMEIMIARGLIGLGSSTALLGTMKIASMVFSSAMFNVASGTAIAIGMLGPVLGDVFIFDVIEVSGWRNAMTTLAYYGVGLVIFMLLIIDVKIPKKEKKTEQITKNIWKIIFDVEVFVIGFLGLVMYSVISAIGDMWGNNFFQIIGGFEKSDARIINKMIYIGYAIGCITIGWIAKGVKNIFYIFAVSSSVILCILSTLLLVGSNISFYTTIAMILVLGIFASAKSLTFGLVVSIEGKGKTGTATSFVNFMAIIGGSIFQTLIGFVMDVTWSGNLKENGDRKYGEIEYHYGIISVLVMFILAIIISLLLSKYSRVIKSKRENELENHSK